MLNILASLVYTIVNTIGCVVVYEEYKDLKRELALLVDASIRKTRQQRRRLVEENEPEASCPICFEDYAVGDEVFHHFKSSCELPFPSPAAVSWMSRLARGTLSLPHGVVCEVTSPMSFEII